MQSSSIDSTHHHHSTTADNATAISSSQHDACSSAAASAALSTAESGSHHFVNWAHTYSCTPQHLYHPSTQEELIEIITRVHQLKKQTLESATAGAASADNIYVRCIGSLHSPTDIAMSWSHMIMLDRYNKILSVDPVGRRIKVQAGVTLKQLNEELPKHGGALANLGSISEQTLAGAISTGTHGTGNTYGIIAESVVELELITADGSVLSCSASNNSDIFKAALCSMGTLGILSTITLQYVPDYWLKSSQYATTLDDALGMVRDGSIHAVKTADELHDERARFWWFPHTAGALIWRAKPMPHDENKASESSILDTILDRYVGYYLLEFLLFLSAFLPLLVPFINRLFYSIVYARPRTTVNKSHLVMNFDCLFKQFVNEWSIPMDKTEEALLALRKYIDGEPDLRVHFPVEVRFTKRDDIWLSPCYGRDSCFIGIIMYRPYGRTIPFEKYFRGFERIMLQFGGRPHWAKDFSLTEEQLRSMYPKWDEFKALRQRLDPLGVFVNPWVRRRIMHLE